MTMTPRVVDLSHHNKVTDLKASAAAGIWGVIHKSSQGSGYCDPDYAPRRRVARDAGLLWGAYHFNDGSDVALQVDWFIKCAQPDSATLMVLDFEDNPKSNMSVVQAVKFLRLLEQKTGRKGAIYSGNRLKETIGQLSAADQAYLREHRLWLCQYGPHAVLPRGFARYWLWQYTGDGVGQQPHTVPGIVAGNGGLDLNAYEGEREQLASEWAPGMTGAGMVRGLIGAIDDDQAEVSTHSKAAEDDQPEIPPMPPVAASHDPDAVGDPDLFSTQKRLAAMNYSPGIPSGVWGGMTAAAIAGFINDRGGAIAIPTSIDAFNAGRDQIRSELGRAEAEGFKRPVSAKRASGDLDTVAKVAPEVLPARRNFLATVWGSIAAFFAALSQWAGDKFDQAWSFFTDHKDDIPTDPSMLHTAWDYLGKVPGPVWFAFGGVVLFVLAIDARRGVKKIVESVQTGARQ